MQPPQQHSWINLAELKSQIIRKLGPERSKQYFDYLNRFLNLKLNKVEFDKLCLRTVGREGIPLHNQLIRLILRNACTKGPVGSKKPLDGPYQNGSNPVVTRASSPLVFPNGDILSPTQRKARTGARRSALGPNGKTNYSSPDSQKPMQHHQEVLHQQKNVAVSGKIPLHAPLGIPYCPVRAPPTKSVGVSDTNSLLDTGTLRARMEPIATTQGLQGVSVDCANAVNNGLDAYLKGLIRSCCELNGPRLGHEPVKTGPAHLSSPISLLDFRVAMEINPRQLGEDWPVLLEKICTRAFEE